MAGDRKPSLMAIFADLLVGVGSKVLTAHAFPGADVWEGWIPWEETPIQDYIESTNIETGPISSILSMPFPEVSPDIPAGEFLLPIIGLGRVFGFRLKALASMIDVSDSVLSDWLTGQVVPVGDERKKTAILSVLYVQLVQHFDGKPHQELLKWLGTPLTGLGNRCPAQALVDGNVVPVVNYLALLAFLDLLSVLDALPFG
jgi:hypothetical protein